VDRRPRKSTIDFRPCFKAAVERYALWQERWRDPVLTALLVMLSMEVFGSVSLSGSHLSVAPVFVIIWFLLIFAAILVASRHWVAIAAILLSSTLTLLVNALRVEHPSSLTICMGSGSLVIFMATLGWVVWRAVFGPGPVTHHRIQGAIVLYLSIALSFAALYEILLALIPGSISGVAVRGDYLVLARGLVYYSLTTLTSTGYGDLLPIHPLVRSLSSLEAVIGQLFPATLLARIVTLEMQARRSNGA
jgi:ion channel